MPSGRPNGLFRSPVRFAVNSGNNSGEDRFGTERSRFQKFTEQLNMSFLTWPKFQSLCTLFCAAFIWLCGGNEIATAQTNVDSWTNRGNGNWFDAGNWSLETVPTATNPTTIQQGTATILAPGAVANSVTLGSELTSQLTIGTGGVLRTNSLVIGVSGIVNIGNGGAAGVLNVPLISNNGEISFNFTNSLTFATPITGSGVLLSEGNGTLILAANNTFAGGIQLDGNGPLLAAANSAFGTGTVQVFDSGVAGAVTPIRINTGITVGNTFVNFASLNLDNAGNIQPTGLQDATAIITTNGGTLTVTNEAGAKITDPNLIAIQVLPNFVGGAGVRPFVSVNGEVSGTLTLVNAGLISGSTAIEFDEAPAAGSLVGPIGNITNSGSINGLNGTAILVAGGAVTLSNSGTISGNVILDNYANQVTLATGSAISGNLNLGTDLGSTLILDGAGSESISQAISGSITNNGSLFKQGTGTWIVDKLVGTIPGGTFINAGTLTVAMNNALGTGNVTASGSNSLLQVDSGVTIGNRIALNQGGSLDNAGIIDGTSADQITSSGGASVLNESTGSIVNHAGPAISFSDGGNLINQAGGTIAGTGGTAISISGGAASVTNSGLIEGGIQLGNSPNFVRLLAGSALRGSLNIGSNSTSLLILDGNGNQLLSQAVTGTINNPGSIVKQGAGNWIVDNPLAAPISTKILSGILTVDSTLTSPTINVQPGGLLKGNGGIFGSVINLGAVGPGHSPGTLTINGNYTQTSSGTLSIEIDSSHNYSRLVVNGHATLGGTLQLTLASGYRPAQGTSFKVLTASEGISGTFQTIKSNTPLAVSYENGFVNVAPPSISKPVIHFSDGTPDSTTSLIADSTFYGFGSSLAERMALGIVEVGGTTQENAVSVSFDMGSFELEGHHGQTYGIPIAGQFKINDRVKLDYEIPIQYITVADTGLLQAGLTLSLPWKVILPSPDQPWSWDVTPTAAFAVSGSREIIGGGALTNVLTYRWHGMTVTYGNYISFFKGSLQTDDNPNFPSGVDQQIMKNGLRFDIPFGKGWVFEPYGIYTQFFQSTSVSSYYTIGAEVGHHFTWILEGQNVDLGFISLGFYTEQGNRYRSGHGQIGSAWKF
jgi:autotransporter-associated beta strand protein